MSVTALERTTVLDKEPLAYRPGHRYALLTDERGTTVTLHDAVEPGQVWLGTAGPRGGKAARLDLAQAAALREALTHWIADQTPVPTTQS